MTDERSLPTDVLAEMLRAVDPEWRLREATPAERGFTAVYRVAVETGTGSRECVLKATHDGDAHGIDVEARLLSLLATRTGIPVPDVIGAVDDRDGVPTPFFVMEPVPGAELAFEETAALPDHVLRQLARQTGEYLGELHAIAAVEAFGTVDRADQTLDGGRPSGDPDDLRVADGFETWPDYLRSAADQELERLADTRFGDLAPRLRPWIRERIEGMAGPFPSVLGRIDHGVHNLLVDPDTGGVEAVLDWGFTLAVAPGYDLQCVEYVLSGAVLGAAPDRRELVREAMCEGYRSSGASYPRDELSAHRALYELLAIVRAMVHLDAGVAKVPAGAETGVASGLRREAETIPGV